MFCLEFVFTKSVKHLAKVCLVFICGSTVHEYIIQVYQRKFVDVFTQYVVHKALERAWSVTQAQGEHSVFIQAIMFYRHSFWSSARSQSNLVITTGQVDCRKKLGFTQLIKQVIYPW